MKWISLLLSVYLLGLTLWPCQDSHPLIQPGGGSSAQVSATSVPTEPPHEHDCSPFCTCACCATSVTAPVVAHWLPEPRPGFVPSRAGSFSYSSSRPTATVVPIWQPPKLNA